MKKIFTLFAAMLLALTVSAKTTSVPTGTNTLQSAVEAADPGDELVLSTGNYDGADTLSITQNITIKAADKAIPVLKLIVSIEGGATAEFKSIKFDASVANDHLIYSNDNTDGNTLIFDSCEFYDFTVSSSLIHIGATEKIEALTMSNCYIHNIKKCFFFNESSSESDLTITNSTFANISTTNSYYAGVIDSRATSGVFLIDHCTFYNAQVINTDYAAIGNNKVTIAGSIVQNSIFMMPSSVDGVRAIRGVQTANNCLTYNYIKDGGGIYSSVTKNNCQRNVNPLIPDTASGIFTPAEDSPTKTAGIGGNPIGDPRWWPASWKPSEVIPVSSITIDKQTLTLDVNETFYLHTTVLPNNATDPSVTWTSKDKTKVTVVNGIIKGIAAGEVMIIATAGEKSDTCVVTVSDAIPSTDFASSYFFMGTKAQLAGYISVNEADSLHYNDRSNPGTATWKINVTDPCFINATANFKTGSASGAKLRVVILDSEDAQVGDSLMQDYHDEDGDLAFTGSIALPKAGIYTVKLVNIQPWSSAKLRGITLTKDASKDVVFKGAWDSWTLHPATSIAADGSSASVKVVLPAGDYDFGVTLGDEFRANGWWLKPEGPMTATDITGNTGTNMKVCPALNLEHTFTWTYATNAVTVTFPEVTVYFVNESDWAVVNAYAWREARTDNPEIKNADWPGIALEPTGEKSEGKDIYSYTFSAYKNIIFSNNGSSKTEDLAVDPTKPYYYAGDWHETLPGEPTAIDNTVVGEKAVKLMENGQIVIIKNGVRYNVLGTVIK